MEFMMTNLSKPIVYSCSGCSNLAEMAHDIALNLDQDKIAEMSCISGVVGDVQPIMEQAFSGRPIFAIDGCNLACTKACLDACKLKPDVYFNLMEYGFQMRSIEDVRLNESCVAIRKVYEKLAEAGFYAKNDSSLLMPDKN